LAIAIIGCKQNNNKMQLDQVIEQGSVAWKGCWALRSAYYTSNCGMELFVMRRSLVTYSPWGWVLWKVTQLWSGIRIQTQANVSG